MSNTDRASALRTRLQRAGLNPKAIDAAWPSWWSGDSEASVSARAELRFSLARKLGLDPRSLLEDSAEPRFVWRDEARFKHLSGEGDLEKAAITSFGVALGTALVAAAPPLVSLTGKSAAELRELLLEERPYIRLLDLLSVCWSAGIPVIHLKIFPWPQKRMAAMTVRVRDRWAILLGKDSDYPAHTAFYLAHELGHIALDHVENNEAIVDLEPPDDRSEADAEEEAADRYSLEVLTGDPDLKVLPIDPRYTSRELGRVALEVSERLRIEPGTLALSFGHATGDWPTANGAMPHIYDSRKAVWREVNQLARTQLSFDRVPDDYADYLSAVLGEASRA